VWEYFTCGEPVCGDFFVLNCGTLLGADMALTG
jgi:hypothetical protein